MAATAMMHTLVVGSCVLILAYFGLSRLLQPASWTQVANALRTLQGWQGPELMDSRSEKVMKQLRQTREHYLKETMALWSLTAELTMLLYFLAQNYYSCWTLAQLPGFSTIALCNWLFQELMKPEVELTRARMRFFTAVMTLAHLVIVLSVPAEASPAVYTSRILTCISSTESSLAIAMNVALAPLFIALQFHMDMASSQTLFALMFMTINEMSTVGIMVMSIATLNSKEYQLEVATIQLEAKIEEVKEAERSGAAAQRLLSVTCDAFLRLTHDLKISQPSASLSDLLMCNFGMSGQTRSLEGVPFTRYVAQHEHERLVDFISESSLGFTPARSLHLQLRDSSGVIFNAELFHVSVPSLTSEQPEHLIGLNQEVAERACEQEEDDSPGELAFAGSSLSGQSGSMPDVMRHMLDRKMKGGEERFGRAHSASAKSSSRSSRMQDVIELRALEKVDCSVTVSTDEDDFAVKQVQFHFRTVDASNRDEVPYLLEWLKPAYRGKIQSWIQAHVNAYYSGCPSTEVPMRGTKFFSPTAKAKTMLAGLMNVTDVQDLDAHDSDESLESEMHLDSDHRMQVRIELRNLFIH